VKKHIFQGEKGDYLLSEIINAGGKWLAAAVLVQWPCIIRTIEVCSSTKEEAERLRFAKIQQLEAA
jgi:hypothetical protein